MIYRISYQNKFSDKGTHYNQTINVIMTREEFTSMNRNIAVTMLNTNRHDYKLYLDTFKRGVNYTTLVQTRYFADMFNLNENKRYKQNRNTVINIILK